MNDMKYMLAGEAALKAADALEEYVRDSEARIKSLTAQLEVLRDTLHGTEELLSKLEIAYKLLEDSNAEWERDNERLTAKCRALEIAVETYKDALKKIGDKYDATLEGKASKTAEKLKEWKTARNVVGFYPNPSDPSYETEDNARKTEFVHDLFFAGRPALADARLVDRLHVRRLREDLGRVPRPQVRARVDAVESDAFPRQRRCGFLGHGDADRRQVGLGDGSLQDLRAVPRRLAVPHEVHLEIGEGRPGQRHRAKEH